MVRGPALGHSVYVSLHYTVVYALRVGYWKEDGGGNQTSGRGSMGGFQTGASAPQEVRHCCKGEELFGPQARDPLGCEWSWSCYHFPWCHHGRGKSKPNYGSDPRGSSTDSILNSKSKNGFPMPWLQWPLPSKDQEHWWELPTSQWHWSWPFSHSKGARRPLWLLMWLVCTIQCSLDDIKYIFSHMKIVRNEYPLHHWNRIITVDFVSSFLMYVGLSIDVNKFNLFISQSTYVSLILKFSEQCSGQFLKFTHFV